MYTFRLELKFRSHFDIASIIAQIMKETIVFIFNKCIDQGNFLRIFKKVVI